MMGIQVCSNEGPALFQIHWWNLKNHWANSTKHGTNHPWVKGIPVCSNEGLRPFPRGINYQKAKSHFQNNLLCQNHFLISTDLSTKHPWVMEIQFRLKDGPALFQGDNYEIAKIHWWNFKHFLLQNHWANFNHTYMNDYVHFMIDDLNHLILQDTGEYIIKPFVFITFKYNS